MKSRCNSDDQDGDPPEYVFKQMPHCDFCVHAAAALQAPYGYAIDGNTAQGQQNHTWCVGGFRVEQTREDFGHDEEPASDEDGGIDKGSEQRKAAIPIGVARRRLLGCVLLQAPSHAQRESSRRGRVRHRKGWRRYW